MKKITEKQIDKVIKKLTDRVNEANTYFLKSIGSSIKKIREVTPSQAHQLEQMLKYGGEYEDIINQITKYTRMNVSDVDKIFYNYAKQDQQFYKQFYKYRNIPFVPFEENIALKTQTMALSNMVKNEVYNFSRDNVLGYSISDVDGNVQFMGLRDTYNKVIDTAFLNVGQGKETFDTAMYGIMKQLGSGGIKTLEFESGRSMRLDSAIEMHLKSRLRELHNENQMIIGEEFGADGVEISVHSNPADDHAEVQGRQFTIEEFEKLQAGEEAKDYEGNVVQIGHSKKGGYRPISEYNCYHYTFAVVLGVNKPEYSSEQLKNINETNEQGFEFEGEHYTNYEGTQMQRAIERAIREQKDTQILAKSSDNEELLYKSQKKIRILTNKYKDLIKASGLPSYAERMRVPGYRRTKVK